MKERTSAIVKTIVVAILVTGSYCLPDLIFGVPTEKNESWYLPVRMLITVVVFGIIILLTRTDELSETIKEAHAIKNNENLTSQTIVENTRRQLEQLQQVHDYKEVIQSDTRGSWFYPTIGNLRMLDADASETDYIQFVPPPTVRGINIDMNGVTDTTSTNTPTIYSPTDNILSNTDVKKVEEKKESDKEKTCPEDFLEVKK